MIDLFYWPTPNGHKITMFLEETGVPYRIIPIDIGNKKQFAPEYLRISPNNKIPAIIDHDPIDHHGPFAIFESGAILLYLAEKTGRLLSSHLRERYETFKWLFWQVAGLGPMAGQNHHFNVSTTPTIPYAIERYVNETRRLYTVLNKQLENKEYIVGDYSIADIACYPWIVPYERQQQNLDDFPYLKRWFLTIQDRQPTKKAYAKALEITS